MAAGRRNEGGEAPLPPHRRHAEGGEKEDTPWNSWLKVGGVNSPNPLLFLSASGSTCGMGIPGANACR